MGGADEGWERIYATRDRTELGWYEEVPATLPDVLAAAPSVDCPIIDVGAGASTLAAHLLERGFGDLTLLDVSRRALDGAVAGLPRPVATIVADVRSFEPERRWALWHDRATFHFLTSADDRRRYVEALDRALTPDGTVVIATFAVGGPDMCAGRPVERYEEASLAAALGDRFECVAAREHRPEPGPGDRRPYLIATFRRRS